VVVPDPFSSIKHGSSAKCAAAIGLARPARYRLEVYRLGEDIPAVDRIHHDPDHLSALDLPWRAESGEDPIQHRSLASEVERPEPDAQLMQFAGVATATTAVGDRQVVEQQQLAR
jgi:hypothetical protein